MKKIFTNLVFTAITIIAISSCKHNIINPNTQVPDVSLSLSESSASTEVIISWNKCNDADGYAITRTFTRDGVTEECFYKNISDDATSYTDSNCEPGTEYTYTVTAAYFKAKGMFYGRIFGDAMETTSDPKSITTKSDSRVSLEHPKIITIMPDSEHTNAVKLLWSESKNATSYEIYQSHVSETHFGEYVEEYEKIQTVDTTEYVVHNIFNENTYRFKVKALGQDGKSSVLSGWKSVVVPAAKNTAMDKAIPVMNGVTSNFYTTKDSLWFKITPTEGKITVYSPYKLDVMIFSADGSEHLKDVTDFNVTDSTSKNSWYSASFSDCITPGETYLLRLKTNERIQFIVE